MAADSAILDHLSIASLVQASSAIVNELDLRQVFLRIAEQAAAVLDADAASVLLLEPDAEQFVFASAVGPEARRLIGHSFDAHLGIAAQAVRARRPIRVDDVRRNRHFFDGIDALTRQRTRSMIAAPLLHAGRALGVVEVLNPRGRESFNDRDLELLQVFANLAAAAASNVQAYEKQDRPDRSARAAAHIIGVSPAIHRIIELCRKVALSTATVLLYGETGTGKELAARAIHDFSGRRDNPFIEMNCAALPETLLESELFGHEKGAFTGASQQKPGRFELADGGTIFLDEVGELAPSIQAKVLRILQERSFVRVGGTQTIRCDVRIIAATNRNLKDEMIAGRFRPDLYYRLNVFPITLPPLRDRPEDIPALVEHFLRQLAPDRPVGIDAAAMDCLLLYPWPGNVRELRNAIERAMLLAGQRSIAPADLPDEITAPTCAAAADPSATLESAPASGPPAAPRVSKLAQQEKEMILQALEQNNWNQSAAARQLGIDRDQVRYRVRKYGLKRP